MAARGQEGKRVGEKMKEIGRHKFPVIKQINQGDVVHSIENIVSNLVTTLYGERQSRHRGDHCIRNINVEP